MNGLVVISKPKKILEGSLAGMYTCEVYLPDQKKTCPFYDGEISGVVDNANKFVYAYLQEKIKRVENYLKEKDVRKKLLEELDWAKKALTEHEQNKKSRGN